MRSPGRPGRCGARGWSQAACQSGLGEGRRPGTSAASATWRVPGPHPWLRWALGPLGPDPRVSSTLVLQPKFCFLHFVPACPVSVGPLLHLCSSGLGAALTWYPQLREVTPCTVPFRDSPEPVPSLGPCGPTWERGAGKGCKASGAPEPGRKNPALQGGGRQGPGFGHLRSG